MKTASPELPAHITGSLSVYSPVLPASITAFILVGAGRGAPGWGDEAGPPHVLSPFL